MRKFILVFLAFFCFLSAAISQSPIQQHTIEATDFHESRLIVKFSDESQLLEEIKQAVVFLQKTNDQTGISLSLKANGLGYLNERGDSLKALMGFFDNFMLKDIIPLFPSKIFQKSDLGIERIFILNFTGLFDLELIMQSLNQRTDIDYAEFDYYESVGDFFIEDDMSAAMHPLTEKALTNDSQFLNQYALRNSGQTISSVKGIPNADMNAFSAWNHTTGSSDIILAVLDSGLAIDHPEFQGRVLAGYNFVSNNANYDDDHGHGTSVSSIAAATGNNGGLMAGVDWNAKILPVKVLNENNSGYYSWWVSGITFAVDNGAHVINMSLSGSSYSQSLHDAVNYALNNDVIVVASMGNNNSANVRYPAGYAGVISVGATNKRDERAAPFGASTSSTSGSSYGNHIDFVAPGNRVIGININNQNNFSYWSGTSMSTPLVAATITLMLAVNPQLTREQVYDILKTTCRPQLIDSKSQQPQWDQYFGWGRVDAGSAVAVASGKQFIRSIYTQGDISTNYYTDNPSECPGVMEVTIPEGYAISGVDVAYTMTAFNSAWMLDQRSRIFSPTTGTGEQTYAEGIGYEGTYRYERTGLDFANGASGTVIFHMDAVRTWGGGGCNTTYIIVDNNSWALTVYYEPAGSIVPQNFALQFRNVQTSESVCYNAINQISLPVYPTSESGVITPIVPDFSVENGGSVILVAGQSIRLLPGTHVKPGGYLHAYITTTGTYCAPVAKEEHVEDPPEELVVGIEEAPLAQQEDIFFKVFPNPTTGSFTLELGDWLDAERVSVEVYNALGSRVLHTTLPPEWQHVLSLSDQQPGIYVVRVIVGDRVGVERLIKR